MSLRFVYSTMGGGKTAQLLQSAYSAKQRGFNTILAGYAGNSRDNQAIKSRAGLQADVDVLFEKNNVQQVAEEFRQHFKKNLGNVYYVDEAQFLSEEQVDWLSQFSFQPGCHVECYGLKTDFRNRLFPGSKRLLEVADTIVEIDIVKCRCGGKATVNALFDANGSLVLTGDVENIEGSREGEYYDPVCIKCFTKLAAGC